MLIFLDRQEVETTEKRTVWVAQKRYSIAVSFRSLRCEEMNEFGRDKEIITVNFQWGT